MIESRASGGDRPVLMDFGLARDSSATEHLTETGMVMGTPAYMAPEQAQGDQGRIDHRSDVYGLGAMLYELMCGHPPFDGQSTVQVLITVLNEDPVPLRQKNQGVPVDVETIVMKCLSKEPQRRYHTALALAQDLGRFLNGEPIEGRQTTLSYRLAKKARKHLSLVALSGLLLLSMGALLAVGVRARLREAAQQRRAAEQAQLAQRLGQDVKEMELFMRAAYALPLHDIRRERQVVRRRMTQIEGQMALLAPESRGPAYYALGRGHMVLHEPEDARRRFQEALSAGYDRPEVKAALGRTLVMIYDKELAAVMHNGEIRTRAARKQRLQTELVLPAQQFLEHSTDAETDSKSLRQAVQSWLHRDLKKAQEAAERAAAEVPWDPEPLRFQALAAHALQLRANGMTADEYPMRAHIAELFAQLTDIARSDPEAHVAEATFWSNQAYRDLVTGRDVRPALERMKVASERAARADPSLPQPRHLLAGGYSYLARWEESVGLDPRENAQRSASLMEETLRKNPEDESAHVLTNNQNLVIASYQAAHGLDPTAALERAIAVAKDGIRFHPNHWTLHNDLFSTYVQLADYKMNHAGDAEPLLQGALQEAEILAQLEDEVSPYKEHHAAYYLVLAERERLRGGDPLPSLDQALPLLRQLLQKKPHHEEALEFMITALLSRAARIQAVADAHAMLEQASAFIDQRTKEYPQAPQGFVARARLAEQRSQWLVASARSPLEEIKAGLAALETVRKLRSQPPEVPQKEAALLLLQAQWLRLHKQPALALLQRAEQVVRQAPRQDNAEQQLALAQALRLQAQELDPRSAALALQQAAQAVARARTLTPQLPHIDAEDAALTLLTAERTPAPQRRHLAGQALSQLTSALQRDLSLAAQYTPLLHRAQALASSLSQPSPASP